MEEVRSLKVINELGMHARAAGEIVELAGRYKSRLLLAKDGRTADGASILSILTLACPKGSEIEARIIGEDAREFMDELERLFEGEFGETVRGQYRPKKRTMKGVPVSPGIVLGRAHHLDRSKTQIFHTKLSNRRELEGETHRFRRAVDMAKE